MTLVRLTFLGREFTLARHRLEHCVKPVTNPNSRQKSCIMNVPKGPGQFAMLSYCAFAWQLARD